MDYAKESLRLHEEWKGKIRVDSAVPVKTMQDLSLAYTPGVAQPCLEIQKDISKSYDLTRRWNICAVITDGSAVLGLGDIGPEAGMPFWASHSGVIWVTSLNTYSGVISMIKTLSVSQMKIGEPEFQALLHRR